MNQLNINKYKVYSVKLFSSGHKTVIRRYGGGEERRGAEVGGRRRGRQRAALSEIE